MGVVALTAVALLPARAAAQAASGPEQQASEVASLVELALTEYRDAVDDGRIVNEMEYAETREFTAEAGRLFRSLLASSPADGGEALAAELDSLAALVERRGPVERFRDRAQRVTATLAERWGAVAVPDPTRRPDAARGARLYRTACAACHGPRGRGDGWAADGMEPPPPDLAGPLRRRDATPARDHQVITYGIPETAMPASRDWLSVDGTWDLVAYLQTLRFDAPQVAEGQGLALGEGSPLSGWVRPWSTPSEVARLTDAELAERVRTLWADASREDAGASSADEAGDAASGGRVAAPSATPDTLTHQQARAVVAYLRTLMGTPAAGVPEPDRSLAWSRRVDESDSLAQASAELARSGEPGAARSTALRAYMAFEGVEPQLRARAPGLVVRAETAFRDLREDAAAGEAGTALQRVRSLLEEARDELSATATPWSLATQSFVIILREGFEAILIVGAILAFLVKTGHEERRRDVYLGVGAALAASVATAFVLERVLSATPASREVLEGATMLLAVLVLFSVSYWLLSKLEHQKWEAYLKEKMRSALGAGSGLALAGVAFLAVYREGFETVIFYQALLGFSEGGLPPVAGGFAAGCVALAVIYLLFTRFGVRMPMRPFFAATSAVLYYMAVVFAGRGIYELQAAGVVEVTRVPGLPRVDLLGLYPTVETLAAQGVLLAALAVALWVTFGRSLRSAGSAARA